LEVGGTHVTAALVDPDGWQVRSALRRDVDAQAGADELIAAWAEAAASAGAQPGDRWGVAMPDPFDYLHGIALFDAGVAKFGALHGVDVGAALRSAISPQPDSLAFVNDADAFALGEWTAGAARGARRCAGLTLGTGIGSGWLVDGVVTDPGTPPGGRIHQMTIDGVPLEDVVSRRAIRRAYATAGGDPALDVREIAGLARSGDGVARNVLAVAFRALGGVVARCTAAFGADVLVVGGSMSASWDLLEPWFRAGATSTGGGTTLLPGIRVAADPDHAGLIGAAAHALR
jgi:glucokinase